MNKLLAIILLVSSVSQAQVKQFVWKVGADGKAIPYYANGKNINLDSAGVYSKNQVDSLFSANVPDTINYVATHHMVDSVSLLKVKYSDTVSIVATKHKLDSTAALRIKYSDTSSVVINVRRLDSVSVLKESVLGNPSSNGMVLSSTTSGTRSWITDTVYQFISTAISGSINALRYTTIGSGSVITIDSLKTVFPMDVTVDRLYVKNGTAGTGTNTGYVRILKNGSATGIAIEGWQTGAVQSDLVHSAAYIAGQDRISIIISPGTGTVDNTTITLRVRVK